MLFSEASEVCTIWVRLGCLQKSSGRALQKLFRGHWGILSHMVLPSLSPRLPNHVCFFPAKPSVPPAASHSHSADSEMKKTEMEWGLDYCIELKYLSSRLVTGNSERLHPPWASPPIVHFSSPPSPGRYPRPSSEHSACSGNRFWFCALFFPTQEQTGMLQLHSCFTADQCASTCLITVVLAFHEKKRKKKKV